MNNMPEHSFLADTNSLAGRSVVVVGAGVIGLGAAANFMGTGDARMSSNRSLGPDRKGG